MSQGANGCGTRRSHTDRAAWAEPSCMKASPEQLPRAAHGLVGAGGRGCSEQRGLVRREVVVDALAVLDHERRVEHQPLQPIRDQLRDPAHDRSAEAVTDQHDVAQVPADDVVRDRRGVVVMADPGAVGTSDGDPDRSGCGRHDPALAGTRQSAPTPSRRARIRATERNSRPYRSSLVGVETHRQVRCRRIRARYASAPWLPSAPV